jgi:colicin import membrane protein
MNRPGTYQHVSAGSMSLLVHGLFIVFLLFSVSWRSQPHPEVEAELWTALPEAPRPLPPIPLPPAPQPVVAPPPEVAKPEPVKPDIALEREKKRLEQEAQKLEALRVKEEARKLELQHQAEEKARSDKEKADKAAQVEKLRQEQLRRDQARRDMDQELARQAREELDAEETQLRGAAQKQQAKASASRKAQISEIQERIRSRIRTYLRKLPSMVGNPEAEFRVNLLPNGEVSRPIILLHSSGQTIYDQEVERAILKASPFPLPADREAAAAFRELNLKIRALDEVTAGR